MSVFRLGLVLPSLQHWEADFGISLVQFSLMMARVKVPGYENNGLKIFNRRSSLIAKSRQELVQDAIKENCSHILFIDSDQVFPPDLAHRLAKHGEMVMACNVATKSQGNSIPTARRAPAPGEWWGGHTIYSNRKHGKERVWRIGFGVILIDLQVFKGVPLPWFNQEWNEEYQEFLGEDWFFCALMDKLGVPIYIDHDVSMKIGHVGKWIFTHDGVEGIPIPNLEAA